MADEKQPRTPAKRGTTDSGDRRDVGNKRAGYTGPSNPKPATSQQLPKNPPKTTKK